MAKKTKAKRAPLYPINSAAYTSRQACEIGRDVLSYLHGTAEDDAIGGAELVERVLMAIEGARKMDNPGEDADDGTVPMCPYCLDTDGDHQDDCERPKGKR